ncbi:uncharacterized protein LOC123508074 isoform X1 [Portunus trituberculatus]|uniref:uncharacterized protein LOC123508074 isoform X1 n=1 Tax=Portunus trituberculatus TaxID=210409 RepID=UPI001E1CC4E7|nr:uncharacterized protein LOC123508074 isoform X1 [Portunus trituberculatus]XP_045117429.1 uncharacterized protein LOC123508074 isoform X1 [Portunus trituberculatus]XP_045117430.1 uncharacterized protein LOC123508074 isoform X1 [Portunus trituberculatus]XP_045117431.1 uncharacterized protein LOC123508074 isoform X1 [Portunus trituberculatus]
MTEKKDLKDMAMKTLQAEDEIMEVDSISSDFQIYRLLASEEGQYSTLVEANKVIAGNARQTANNFNLLMADVSYSMVQAWPDVIDSWNKNIKDKLTGTTKLYLFSDEVTFLRSETYLSHDDRVRGGTNVTAALKRVRAEIETCRETVVQVFIITDGGHGAGEPLPETEIVKMHAPHGKTVNVFLLGITSGFPVNYSIDIRSHLHNGSATIPSLYWAKENSEIDSQMEAIGKDMNMCHVKMTLNHDGYILPGTDSTSVIRPGEWMYFPRPPEEIVDLKVTIDSEERKVYHNVKEANVTILLEYLYPQWNSVLIQRHRKKQHVPRETFGLMDSLFQVNLRKMMSCSTGSAVGVKNRLMRKAYKKLEYGYATLKNMSRTIIEVEGRYKNEIELANNILRSTVSGRKYEVKNLKLRGHGTEEYQNDVEEFRKIYNESQEAIKALPPSHPDECCRITMTSTLTDLQDDEFLLMLEEGKYELLRNFTMTGIPAFSPVRDASQINVWTLTISHMLVMPFTILSQRAIEEKVSVEGSDDILGFINKDVLMKDDDEKSRFNIIIPIVPASAATALRRVVQSKLYAMMATFCILKNPHIIDFSAHLAALACAWVKSLSDHPPANRPSYVTERMGNITATAELYMERKTVKNYINVILTESQQALMTESVSKFNEQTIKCESLVKPLFFLAMRRDKLTASQLENLLPLLLTEYIGRCLSNYKVTEKDATPFTDFFAPELIDPKKMDKWLVNTSQDSIKEFKESHGNLLASFYAPENVEKAIKGFIENKKKDMEDHILDTASLQINMDKVKHLKNVSSCGEVRFFTFGTWAEEMGVPKETIKAAYEPSQVLIYVCEALNNRSSKERMSKTLGSHSDCLKIIKEQVKKEIGNTLLGNLRRKIAELTVGEWKKEYLSTHEQIVKPLSLEQVVAEAQARGIDVTEDTFKLKYRYNAQCKLLRNACQIPVCPFYLVPNRRFNQHLAVERVFGHFPHSLHVVSKEMCDESVEHVMGEIITGSHSGRKNRKKCPIVEPEPFQKLEPEIQELMKIYKLSTETT